MGIAELQALAADTRVASYNGRLSKTQADRLFAAIDTVAAPGFTPPPAPVRRPSIVDSAADLATTMCVGAVMLGFAAVQMAAIGCGGCRRE